MDIQQLMEMQRWSLEHKIAHSIDKITSFIAVLRERGRGVYVSISGGKDSTVMLDIIRRYIDPEHKISVVFCNTGNEYPEIIRFVRTIPGVTIIRPAMSVKQVIAKHGFPLLSKETAHSIYQAKTTKSEKLRRIRLYGTDPANGRISGKIPDCWHFLIDEDFMVSSMCCDRLKKHPLKKYEYVTGEAPIIGTMASDSNLRQQVYIRRGGCNSFQHTHTAGYPLSIWTDKDIWEYIRRYNVPYCEIYDKGATRTGCMVCGFGAHIEKNSRFELLYDLHPKAYRIFLGFTNNGIPYRDALRKIGVALPDECRQLKMQFQTIP